MDEKYEIDSLPIGWEESSTAERDDLSFDTSCDLSFDASCDISTDTAFDTSTDPSETQTEGEAESDPAESDSMESASTESSPETGDSTEPPFESDGQYIGCQESKVTAGEYAVRFLFHGSTPVFCAEGGGQLALEITAEHSICAHGEQGDAVYEGDFLVCTFRGLRAEGRYVFRVFAYGTWVPVIYDGGQFLGHGYK
jgi:hypothetical protein